MKIVNTKQSNRRYPMYENSSIQTIHEQNTLQDILINDVREKISEAAIDAENVSKEKYAAKAKMIEAATDMSIKEKLDAMDKNYDRRNQERWQNVLCFAVVSLSVVGLAVGSPVAVKNIRKLFTAA